MILQRLVDYYDMLRERNLLPDKGWENVDVSFAIDINEQGDINALIPLGEPDKRGNCSRKLDVPARIIRTSGKAANLFCDTGEYLFGIPKAIPADISEPNRQLTKAEEDAQLKFSLAAELHTNVLQDDDSTFAEAIKRFFSKNHSSFISTLSDEIIKSLGMGKLCVFYFEGMFPCDDGNLKQDYKKYYDAKREHGKKGTCSVTGEYGTLVTLHPQFKIIGGQSSGAPIVSYNFDAANSYGHEKSENTPIGADAAEAYGIALNYLLNHSNSKMVVGETTIVYWAANGDPAYQMLANDILTDADTNQNDLDGICRNIFSGKPIEWEQSTLEPEMEFYILGLAPNAGRISVNMFLVSTFGEILTNLLEHYQRLKIVHAPWEKETLLIRNLLDATTNKKSKNKEIPDELIAKLLISILTNERYPTTIFNGVMQRIRAEHEVDYPKAALIKAYLLKNSTNEMIKEALTMELNSQTKETAYVLGCLFAVLQDIQEQTGPKNSTIKDKYLSTASSNPSVVFPLLLRLANNHLPVIARGHKDWAISYEKKITDLIGKLDKEFPTHLTLQEQGTFMIGYYQQIQKRYQKSEQEA